MTYQNFTLIKIWHCLRVKNHEMITYSKVFDNRARLAQHPSTYKTPC